MSLGEIPFCGEGDNVFLTSDANGINLKHREERSLQGSTGDFSQVLHNRRKRLQIRRKFLVNIFINELLSHYIFLGITGY